MSDKKDNRKSMVALKKKSGGDEEKDEKIERMKQRAAMNASMSSKDLLDRKTQLGKVKSEMNISSLDKDDSPGGRPRLIKTESIRHIRKSRSEANFGKMEDPSAMDDSEKKKKKKKDKDKDKVKDKTKHKKSFTQSIKNFTHIGKSEKSLKKSQSILDDLSEDFRFKPEKNEESEEFDEISSENIIINDKSSERKNNNNSITKSHTLDSLSVKKHKLSLTDQQITQIYESSLLCIFLPINSEVMYLPQKLLLILQTALNVSNSKHDQLINNILEYCQFECVLTQLETQLENIKYHAFYQPVNFPDEQEYQRWVRNERTRLQEQRKRIIDSHPGIESSASYKYLPPPCGYHTLFQLLARQMIEYETRENTSGPSLKYKAEKTDSYLSESSSWLLNEYGERYGVRELFRQAEFIKIVLDLFECELRMTHFLDTCVARAYKLLKMGEAVTNNERDSLLKSMETLLEVLEHEIVILFTSYSRPPELGAFSNLIATIPNIQLICELFNKRPLNEMDFLTKNLKVSIAQKYMDIISNATTPEDKNSKFPITPKAMTIVCEILEIELLNSQLFAQPFKEYIDLTDICGKEYVRLIQKDIEKMCSAKDKFPSDSILGVARKFYELNEKLKHKFRGFTTLPLMKPFIPYVEMWMNEITIHLAEFIDKELEKETWEQIDKNHFYSHSANILVSQIYQKNVGQLQNFAFLVPPSDDKKKGTILHRKFYELVVVKTVENYAIKIAASFFEEFPISDELEAVVKPFFNVTDPAPAFVNYLNLEIFKEENDTIVVANDKKDKKEEKALKKRQKAIQKEITESIGEADITPELCVRISNLIGLSENIERSSRRFMEEFGSDFAEVKALLKNAATNLTRFLIFWMSNKIQLEILGYFKRKRADGTKISSTEELIMYIDSQIGIIVLNLDSSVFQKEFLPSLWEAVIFNLRMLLLELTSNGKKITSGIADRSNEILNQLKEYFYQGGKGLPEEFLNDGCAEVAEELKRK